MPIAMRATGSGWSARSVARFRGTQFCRRFREAVELVLTDWRDLLVAAELAQADWPGRLGAELGPERPGRTGQVTA